MPKLRTLSLPAHRGREFFLTVFVEPDPAAIESFSVPGDADQWGLSVHFQPDDHFESHVEVARIDTSHGEPHFDRLYTPTERKEWLGDDYSFEAARRDLLSNWQTYAERYFANHTDDAS